MGVYERLARPVLFRLAGGDAEAAHEWTMRRLASLGRWPRAVRLLRRYFATQAPRTLFGVRFPSPVGVAAGMDKNGTALAAWPALGFGFVEVGTVTWHPQPGNPRPRLFRLRDSEAIINRMGFNNAGAQALADRLAEWGPLSVPLGISLGKSKVTPLADAAADYAASYALLRPYGDYFAVNVSSPNTPGLRSLQDKAALGEILAAMRGDKPILVKIAPDLTEHAIGELLEVCAEQGVAGLIATNTTLGRQGLAASDARLAEQSGGLSGRPLAARARQVVEFVASETGGTLPIIGVGGIDSPADALRMMDAGASVVQLYTGLIYRGPGLVRAINRAVAM